MKNKNVANKQQKNVLCEHHSNLALLTTAVAMIAFMVLMVIYMGLMQGERFSQTKFDMALAIAPVAGVICWILAAVIGVVIAVKKKSYLVEYFIYSLFMGFALFFLFEPGKLGFIFDWLYPTGIFNAWSINAFWGTCIVSGVYFLLSIVWHSILGTPKKGK